VGDTNYELTVPCKDISRQKVGRATSPPQNRPLLRLASHTEVSFVLQ
jgi:hypothetical protein